ncbi:DUF302 domain-containing protein [Streptomyces sp. NBC_01390]|uniref:DUF302 domain-containing protein n=1 Tax=Streptomyces sp. NBC_01390 TaxID=2903850 RepID=UPI00324E4D07
MSYDRTVSLTSDFAATVDAVREALAAQGFGVLTEIDVTATLKAKLGHDMEDYLILGACNPALAHRAIEADRAIGLLLPCNVVVRREGDHTLVQALDPNTMVALTGLPALRPVAQEAAASLDAALASLA